MSNESDLPIGWNPHNKVVQDHRDGTIDHRRTNIVRKRLGLPVPWNPSYAELEMRLPPIYSVFPQSKLPAGLWKNNKKGTIYRAFDEVINTTNAQNGQIMIAYRDVTNPDKPFVREHSEFFEKFEQQLESES